jgi:hypothetical protein
MTPKDCVLYEYAGLLNLNNVQIDTLKAQEEIGDIPNKQTLEEYLGVMLWTQQENEWTELKKLHENARSRSATPRAKSAFQEKFRTYVDRL